MDTPQIGLRKSQNKILFIGGLVLLLAVTLLYCSPERSDITSPQAMTDSEITKAIETRLHQAGGLPYAENMVVQVDSGVAVLTGQTDNLLAKDRAERIAESVRGVRTVVNDLNVISDRPDQDILQDVDKALASDPAAREFSIDTAVDNGTVSLAGKVDTWQERKLVQTVVKTVDGVTGITNNIQVAENLDLSDEEISGDITATMKWDSRLDANLINVQVNDHDVTLTGSVASALEKQFALEDSYVAGVSVVDDSQLKIQPELHEKMIPELESPLPDEDIAAAIKHALTLDPRVHSSDIGVTVVEGHVTLTGAVDNIKAKESASQDALNTLGVWSVENAIKQAPVNRVSDDKLKQEIQEALTRNPYIDPAKVRVKVERGSVTLSGEADSYFHKWAVGDEVAKIGDVVQITNDITVPYDEPVFERPFYGWDPVNEDYDYVPVEKTDEAITSEIIREISWSPFLNEHDIYVSVHDGVATLTGSIHTWYQRNKATDLAYKSGAVKVDNKLKYEFGPLVASNS